MSASGDLVEVFEISGRGLVVLLENFEGVAHVGDYLWLGKLTCEIRGMELPNFRTVEAAEKSRQRRMHGFLVAGVTKSEIELHKGQRLQISTNI